jgi:hypothetical protein
VELGVATTMREAVGLVWGGTWEKGRARYEILIYRIHSFKHVIFCQELRFWKSN